jgi:hypothetical protein
MNLKRGLMVDAFATLGAGLAGTSRGTAYVESIAGIRMGARTDVAQRLSRRSVSFPVSSSARSRRCTRLRDGSGTYPRRLVDVSVSDEARTLASLEDGLPAFVTIVLIPTDAVDHAGHAVGLPAPRAALYRRRSRERSGLGAMGARGVIGGVM